MRILCGCFLVLLAALFAPRASAAGQDPLVFPELSNKRLLNNLQVTVASAPGQSDDMAIGWVLRYGSAFDPAGKGGLAYLTSQMLGRATIDRTAKNIQDELALLGATLEVQCDWDRIQILLRGHAGTFERALLLLYQIVGEASFLAEDFEALKAERLAQLGDPEDPRQGLRSRFERELFSGTTYGRPLRGGAATLRNITLGDVRHFYNRHFSSSEAALVIAGPAPASVVLQKSARIWGVWVRRESVPFTFLPPRTPSSRSIVLEDDAQSLAAQFIVGGLWPQRGDSVYYAARLIQGIVQERLTGELPTSLLTVGAEARRLPGPLYIQGQAAADQAVTQIQRVLEVVETFRNSGGTQQELDSAATRWIEEFHRSLGSVDGVCRALLEAELYRLGTNYLGNFADMVRRNDLDAVKQAAKDWLLPGGSVILVRGPAASLRPGLSLLGNLRESSP